MLTISDRVAATNGRSSGFDYLRIALAVSIVCLHSFITAKGFEGSNMAFQSLGRPLFRYLMPGFFALSGFLVAGSLARSKTLLTFLGLRVIRIYPALAVESLLSAIVLGPLVTALPLQKYFTDPQFLQYMLNIIGDVHFTLPGVFLHNPIPNVVNFQLWTIPFELCSYCCLALAAIIGVRKHRVISVMAIFTVTLGYLGLTLYRHGGQIVPVVGAPNGFLLVATFLAGVSIYLYMDVIPWNAPCALVAAALTIACLGWLPFGDFLAVIPTAYITVWLGLLNPSRKYLFGADYSYGIYLYSFAIQQSVLTLLPFGRVWYVNLIFSLAISTLAAALSWRLVEKPAQRARGPLKAWEQSYLRFMEARRRPRYVEPVDSALLAGSEAAEGR